MSRNIVVEAAALERRARDALVLATAARLEAERIERQRKRVIHNRWIEGQLRAAAPDPSESLPELIVYRSHPDASGGPILWDIHVENATGGGAGGRSRYGEPSRRNADTYARQMRSRGYHVRVLQAGN